jgi:antitoxin (DNA-binding transcriptional repressor) of toxin-antitoxin stability system
MAIEVGAFEAKNKLSKLLAEVERGQRVYITRRGKRVAMLCKPEEEDVRLSEPQVLLTRVRDFRKRVRTGPESLKDLIDEGRR